MYGYYVHPSTEDGAEPVVVRLLANPEDRVAYAKEGYEYLGEAPAPGTSTPEEEAAGLKKAQLAAAGLAKKDDKAEEKAEEPQRAIPRTARA